MTLPRRKFIRNIAASSALLSVNPLAFSKAIPTKKNKKIGVALVGLGYYSQDLLAPALQLTKHCYLAGIVTGSPEKAKVWQKKYSIPDANIYDYENFDSIVNNKDIDVVYIVLPTFRHKDFVVRAAQAGKHVWCEKPMAMTVAECETMIKVCKENKRKLSIGYRMHHEPITQQIIQFGKQKKYGQVQLVAAAAGYKNGWTSPLDTWKLDQSKGGGAMYDMGVYPLNAARYVTGKEPIAVSAQTFNNNPDLYRMCDMTTNFQLEFSSDIIANCTTSIGINMNYLNVNATEGFYNLLPFQAYNNIKGVTSDGLLTNTIPNQQAVQMDNDALSIINDTAVLVPGMEGLKDIKVIEAIQKSVKEQRRVMIG